MADGGFDREPSDDAASPPGQIHRVLPWFAAGAFVVEVLLAEIVLRFVWHSGLADLLLSGRNLVLSAGAGVVLAAGVAAATRVYFAKLAGDLMSEVFLPVFRGLSNGDVVLLSVLPALGEEALFRGVIQAAFGIIPASLFFALLHSGFSRRLLPYGLWTLVVGGLLGALYLWTGNLWGSIVAHAAINVSGALWARQEGAREKRTGPGEE
jgi:membrane protease YdiL (CAAX protease family)